MRLHLHRSTTSSGLFAAFAVMSAVSCSDQQSNEPSTNVSNAALTRADGRPSGKRPAVREGEVLVKLRKLEHAEALRRSSAAGGRPDVAGAPGLSRELGRFGVHRAHRLFPGARDSKLQRTFRLQATGDAAAMIESLRSLPEVEYAELNRIVHVVMTTNDSYYGSSNAWGQGFRDLWGLQAINAPAAWDTTQGSGVVVAVIDSGVDYNHADIKTNIWQNPGETGTDSQGRDKRTNGVDDDNNGFRDDWHGWNFVSDGNDPMDDNGHGTHVAGTIAAVANNAEGIVGVAPQAKIMALKGIGADGYGTTADLADAICFAANNGARVINASWGDFFDTPIQTELDAIAYAHDTKGVVFVAAAGNNNGADVGLESEGFQPASARNAIAVSAFNHTNTFASFSNRGPKIDVAAPGGGDADPSGLIFDPRYSILSLLSTGATSDTTASGQFVVGERYLRLGGTSMAAPHVSGVAALILARNPSYSPEQVRQVLRTGSTDVTAVGFDLDSGYGLVNATGALSQATPPVVHLLSPSRTLSGLTSVDILGIVSGPTVDYWRLEWGPGAYPYYFTSELRSGSSSITGKLTTWDLSGATEGPNTLHLYVHTSTGASYEDRMIVNVNNVVITSPRTDMHTSFRDGPVTVTGTVAPAGMSSYTVSIWSGRSGWLANPAVTLPGGGTQPVRNGTIATWTTTGLPADHYDIYVRASLANGTVIERKTSIILDPMLHPGWPVPFTILLPSSGMGLSLLNHLTARDLNGDGLPDLIVGYGTQVTAIDHRGAVLPGWPRNVNDTQPAGQIQNGPAVGDIDGDGNPEVVASNNAFQLLAWHQDGSAVAGWPVWGPGNATVSIADIDGNGMADVIAADGDGLTVVRGNGTTLPGFPIRAEEWGQTAVGDVNGDGRNEIVAVGKYQNGQLWVFRGDATVAPGWPRRLTTSSSSASIYSMPVLADVDRNGVLDIVIGDASGRTHAFRYDGSELPGWPQQGRSTPSNSPSVGDLDGDGRFEIVAGNQWELAQGYVNSIYAWRDDGTRLSGWPFSFTLAGSSPFANFGFGAAALADIDGNGQVEVIVTSDADSAAPAALHALRVDGTEMAGWPRPTPGVGFYATNTAVVADVDGDGLMELAYVDTQGEIRLYDLTAPAASRAPWPMFQHDAAHTGVAPAPTGGSGGASGSGGRTGSGGASGSGGRTGSGGASGSGGRTGSGGVSGSGGRTGSGGVSGSGGRTGSGGAIGSGGRTGSGGSGGATQPCTPSKTITGGQSGNFNTTGPFCFRTPDNIHGWGCSNFDGRTVSINKVATPCGKMPVPAKWNDGYYYFQSSAGTFAWASIYWW